MKNLKADEDKIKRDVIDYLIKYNTPSINFKGLAHVVLANKKHLEVTDKELFSQTVLRSLVAAFNDGRPFVDGMLAQLRPSKEAVYAYLESNSQIDLASCGLREVTEPELALRKGD